MEKIEDAQKDSPNSGGVFNGLGGYCSQLAAAQHHLFNSAFPNLTSQSLTAQQLVSLAQFRFRHHSDPGAFQVSAAQDRDPELTSRADSSCVFAFPPPIHPGSLHLASPGSTVSSKEDRESVISNAPTPPAVVIPRSSTDTQSSSYSASANPSLDKLLQRVNDYGVEAALSSTNHKRPAPSSSSTLVLVTTQPQRTPHLGHSSRSSSSSLSNGNCSLKSPQTISASKTRADAPAPSATQDSSLDKTDDSETEQKQPASATALIKTESKSAIGVERMDCSPEMGDHFLFSTFLEPKHLPKGKIITASSADSDEASENGINLEEIKEFAKIFKMKRLSLGLTQTQVGQALSLSEGPAYSQSAICRFEKLDITPKSAQKIKPVLEKWMREIDDKIRTGQITPGIESNGVNPKEASPRCPPSPANQPSGSGSPPSASSALGLETTKKRKRRTSFTPQALDLLSQFFERNTHPSGAEMTALAENLNYDREVVRVWFCNKRQALKNTIKKLKHDTH